MDRLPKSLLSLVSLFALLTSFTNNTSAADVPSRIGGGNIGTRLSDAEVKFQILGKLGAGMCRIPVHEEDYWRGPQGTPHPERLDELMLLAHRHGITPILLFEYYTRWNKELGGYEKWKAIGKAFAERFRPNSAWLKSESIEDWGVTFYSAINEPMWKSNNPTPIPPAAYAAALEGLADGVHAVDDSLCVNPGGWIEGFLFANKNPYVRPVAPLFNKGKLHAIGIHRYWDVDYVPMEGKFRFSLQNQFDEVKRKAGITADVKFYTDELNFKKRKVTEDEAARGFLTALWDALGVVGNRGQVVTEFVLPWNVFHLTAKDENYGLCIQQNPWKPTARGRVLAMVCRLTDGMQLISADPKGRGVFVLEGDGKKLWVWQNRTRWTDQPGNVFTVTGIPAAIERTEVYGWDGLRKTVNVNGESCVVDGLAEGETYMFLAAAKSSADD